MSSFAARAPTPRPPSTPGPVQLPELKTPRRELPKTSVARQVRQGQLAARTVRGEVVEIRPDALLVRPWDGGQPKSIEVRLVPDTRVLKQSERGMGDLKLGELVLLVPDRTPQQRHHELLKDVPDPLSPSAVPAAGKKKEKDRPKRLDAVLHFWNTEGAPITLEDETEARFFLGVAAPFFKGEWRAGVEYPTSHQKPIIGVVEGTRPLRVGSEGVTHDYRTDDETLVVQTEGASFQELKRGDSVVVRGGAAAGQVEPVLADMVIRTAKPRIRGGQLHRYIEREQRRTDPTDPFELPQNRRRP